MIGSAAERVQRAIQQVQHVACGPSLRIVGRYLEEAGQVLFAPVEVAGANVGKEVYGSPLQQ